MRYVMCALASTVLLAGGAASEVSKTLILDARSVAVARTGSYGTVRYAGWAHVPEPGSPMLPARSVLIALPEGQEAMDLVVEVEESLVVAADFVPSPCQPPAILPMVGIEVPRPAVAGPDPHVYQSAAPYPARLTTPVTTGYLRGTPVASTVLVPFRWKPQQRELVFYPRIRLRVRTKPTAVAPVAPRVTSPVGRRFHDRLLVLLQLDAPSRVPISRDAYDYVIICARECSTAYAQLADWKTRKGVRSVVVTRELIEISYPGLDVQDQIRNCVKDYYENHGIWCLLLGGDSEYLLTRKVWAMDCEAGMYPDENEIRADMYFSDMDGTWDADGDGTYGETTDQVDMYPDVLVGRAPADDVAQAQGLVDKFIEYETTAPADYQDQALFFAEILWSSPYTDAGVGKDMIDSLCFPPSLDPIQKLYESLGNETPAAVIAALNDGRNLANHGGHANSTVMGAGTGYIDNSDMDGLSNTSRYTTMYSIGCWAAALDKDCIAEHFMQNSSGGGVGFIGNSRYGWGSPGNPGFGYSDLYDQQFWLYALESGGATAGEALARMKVFFIPFSQQENVYRIHQYQVNLLGEPDLPVWTDLPTVPVVAHPEDLVLGTNVCQVAVQAAGLPRGGALVCLHQDGGEYVRGYTDASGIATLEATIAAATPVDLTVTGHNLRPYSASLPVVSGVAHLQVTSQWFEEVSGPANGTPNPGEDLYLSVHLHNAGSAPSGTVATVLRAPVGWLTVTDSTESFPSVGAGQTAVGDRAYRLGVSGGVGPGHACALELELSTAVHTDTISLPLVVGKPLPHAVAFVIDDDGGDSHLDPGEFADVTLRVANAGTDTAYALQVSLQSLDPWLVITPGASAFGSVPPGAECSGAPPFEFWLGASAPVPDVASVSVDLQDSRWSWQETVGVALGAVGFSDEMEAGVGAWSTPGGANHWQRTTWRSHSGSFSWYCGQGMTHQYYNSSRDTLVSPVIVVDDDATLSFWTWFDVTIYGVDGMHVQALGPNGWTELGYIGSGGALEGRLMGHDWAPYTYDLGWLPQGAQSRVRFVFWSDGSDVEEGFYLDDVVIASCSRTAAAPCGLGAERVGGALRLSWQPVSKDLSGTSLPAVASFYHVYRDSIAHFEPAATNLVMSWIQDQNPSIPGVQWTDFTSAVGDPSVWHFYKVSAVWAGVEGVASDGLGEADFDLSVSVGRSRQTGR